MPIIFKEIQLAFDFVSSGRMDTNQAFLNKETGKIYWHSEYYDNEEELPEDVDDTKKYIEIPHQNELELGKSLALDFAYECLPHEAEKVEGIFRRKGAYSRFKDLLARNGALEKWYEYESFAQEKALRTWCEENNIEIQG